MAITPPTDAELREAALLRLRLLGVDLSVLPTSTTDPNPTNSPTQEAVIAACVTQLRAIETAAAQPQLTAEPAFFSANLAGLKETHRVG